MRGRRLGQVSGKKRHVLIAEKDRLAVVAAQDDVLRLTGDDETGQAGHGLIAV
jgi:hypothetical protein